jgi:hypothetical protein
MERWEGCVGELTGSFGERVGTGFVYGSAISCSSELFLLEGFLYFSEVVFSPGIPALVLVPY